jgi:probable phosphoglycerate mutase
MQWARSQWIPRRFQAKNPAHRNVGNHCSRKGVLMAIFLLIRHGENDMVGKGIAGRMPGVHLNDRGREQAGLLADRLRELDIAAVVSSPLERTRETAEPLAEMQQKEVLLDPDLLEVDYGDWTGRSFEELEGDPVWKRYNAFRSGTRIPGGEIMTEIQARMIRAIDRLNGHYGEGVVAVVSHGDPLKTVLAHYLGISLDYVLRMEISTCSISRLELHPFGPKILSVNETILDRDSRRS